MKYLTSFNQIRILPQITEVESRTQCDTYSKFFNWNLSIPLFPASMKSLCSEKMIYNSEHFGTIFPQPRGSDFFSVRPCFSCGLDTVIDTADRIYDRWGKRDFVLFLEIANGYQWKRMEKIRSDLYNKHPDIKVVGGTVADYDGAKLLQDIGFDSILLGIGVGEVCETTKKTGVGLPAIASLMDVKDKDLNVPIILCGGIRTYGDFCKAIALGADFVMSGSLFAPCLDTISNGTRYWGEASETAKKFKGGYIEGTIKFLDSNNKTTDIILQEAKEALQSAMSYSNSFNLSKFRNNVKIVELV